VPAYGRSFYVPTTNAVGASGTLALYPQFDKTRQPAGDSDEPGDGPSKPDTFLVSKCDLFYVILKNVLGTDQCGNTTNGPSGLFTFKGMISTGFLDSSGVPAGGINHLFDNCSQTVCHVIWSSEAFPRLILPNSHLFTIQVRRL